MLYTNYFNNLMLKSIINFIKVKLDTVTFFNQ